MTLNVVITGANRGIGLSFCKHYNALGHKVYGVCRSASKALEEITEKVIDGVDVSTQEGCQKLKEGLSGVNIDILVNNAGILFNETLESLNFETIEKQFQVNSMGVLRVTESLMDNLAPQAKIAIITSRMGSVADNGSGSYYGYRMSKAAVNAAGKSLSIDLAPREISVGLYHPGYVTTDMTRGGGDISPDQSAKNLIGLIDKLDMSNSGTFWHSNGEILPW